jgi:hypothetical protein
MYQIFRVIKNFVISKDIENFLFLRKRVNTKKKKKKKLHIDHQIGEVFK